MTATTPFPRFNIYTAIHKALRSQMCDALCRVGRLDTGDEADLAAGLARLEDLLATCAGHLAHENDFLHTAIEARAPAGSALTAADHLEHVEAIARLRAQAAALASAPAPARDPLALALYRDLALFVAENFEHMQVEETVNVAALWAHYTDAELLDIHDRLVASLKPEEQLATFRWMVPAITPFERTCVFKEMKEKAPPEALLGVLAHVQPHLDMPGWIKLTRSIKVPQVPGLVSM